MRSVRSLCPPLGLVAVLWACPASSQDSLDVVFHAIDSGSARVFAPGQFNEWGPNRDGRIEADAPSAMHLVDESVGLWRYVTRLAVGEMYEYKIHTHADDAGGGHDHCRKVSIPALRTTLPF